MPIVDSAAVNTGYMCLFEPCFSPDVGLRVGLLEHLIALILGVFKALSHSRGCMNLNSPGYQIGPQGIRAPSGGYWWLLQTLGISTFSARDHFCRVIQDSAKRAATGGRGEPLSPALLRAVGAEWSNTKERGSFIIPDTNIICE